MNTPVTREEVIWCYRLLLGREPESESIIEQQLLAPSRTELIEGFLTSLEFARRLPGLTAQQSSLTWMQAEPVRIDVDISEAQLREMLERVKEVWRRLGNETPHWSVMSDAEFLPAKIADSMERFWELGEKDTEMFHRTLQRIGFGDLQGKTCLEYGCGIGRMSGPISRLFGTLHACDISPPHLAMARQRVGELGRNNVVFHEMPSDPRIALPRCDVYYSRIVIQHNPPPVMRLLVCAALDCLNPGGVAVFQLPSYLIGYWFDADAYLAQPFDADAGFEMHCLPQAAVLRLIAERGCEVLELHEDGAGAAPRQLLSNTYVVRRRDRWSWKGALRG